MTTPQPNEEFDGEVSDENSSMYEESDIPIGYVIRFTPMEKYTLDDVKTWLSQFDCWLVAVEVTPKLHYHIVIKSDLELAVVKDLIRKFLYVYWPKRERGWGSAQYNCQVADDIDLAVSYALKDRLERHFSGFTEEYITERLEASFPRKSVSNFKIEYQDLCTKFQESSMDVRQFMIAFVTLKAKYGQQVRMSDAYSYALSNLVRRDPTSADELVEEYLYKQ